MTASTDPSRHTNRLIHETSPYLLQHAHNPVDWYPWGEEALARAKAENRPILLSIGYSACHWCHVMERESFEDEAVASLMNRHFVYIKVDREERPDLDDIYMAATLALNHGQGGWPMTVFLTPDQRPFFAGTYFPPRDGFGRPGFSTLLTQIADLWDRRRPDLVAAGGDAHRAPPRAGRVRPGWERRRGGDTCRRAGTGRRVRPDLRRIRPRAQVPPGRADLASPPTPPADRRRCRPGHGDQDPRRHGPGRDVRPDRRRLCPLLHRRALAGPPLREDAVRQRPAREDLPGGLPGHGGRLLCPDRPRDPGVHPAGDGRPRGRVLFGHRRRLRGRGGQVLRLDAGRGGGGPGPRRGRPALRLFRHHRRRQLGGQEHPAHAALGRAGRRASRDRRGGIPAEPGGRPGPAVRGPPAAGSARAGRQDPHGLERDDAGGDGGGRAGPRRVPLSGGGRAGGRLSAGRAAAARRPAAPDLSRGEGASGRVSRRLCLPGRRPPGPVRGRRRHPLPPGRHGPRRTHPGGLRGSRRAASSTRRRTTRRSSSGTRTAPTAPSPAPTPWPPRCSPGCPATWTGPTSGKPPSAPSRPTAGPSRQHPRAFCRSLAVVDFLLGGSGRGGPRRGAGCGGIRGAPRRARPDGIFPTGSSRTTTLPARRRPTCRCCAGRASSMGRRRSTSAGTSPARRR